MRQSGARSSLGMIARHPPRESRAERARCAPAESSFPAKRDRAAHRVRAHACVRIALTEPVLTLRPVARLGNRRAEAWVDGAAERREVVLRGGLARERHAERAARRREIDARM